MRAPTGYDEENPGIEYLKLKSFVVYHYLTDEDLLQKDFVKKVSGIFKAAKPMIDFLNRAEF